MRCLRHFFCGLVIELDEDVVLERVFVPALVGSVKESELGGALCDLVLVAFLTRLGWHTNTSILKTHSDDAVGKIIIRPGFFTCATNGSLAVCDTVRGG